MLVGKGVAGSGLQVLLQVTSLILGSNGHIGNYFPRTKSGCGGAVTFVVSFESARNILCHADICFIRAGQATEEIDKVHGVTVL